jgi:hypothetical protein
MKALTFIQQELLKYYELLIEKNENGKKIGCLKEKTIKKRIKIIEYAELGRLIIERIKNQRELIGTDFTILDSIKMIGIDLKISKIIKELIERYDFK